MYRFESAAKKKEELLNDFLGYMGDLKLRSVQPLDVNIEFRIVSFRMNKQRLGRMYMRYGIILLYKYNEDYTNLLDMRCYRFFDKGMLLRVVGYENHFRSLLLYALPDIFGIHKIPYKVKLVNAFPPFEDEAFETVKQEVVFENGFTERVNMPNFGFFILEIEGIELVCRIWYKSLIRATNFISSDTCNMPVLLKLHPNIRIHCMLKEDFLEKRFKWIHIEKFLGVFTRDCTPYDAGMYTLLDFNHIGKCEDIKDEDMYEIIDGEIVKTC